MNPQQIQLIQESFARISGASDIAAELFYSRLFTLDPQLRRLFRGDMKEQGRMLMGTLAIVVAGLEKLDSMVPAIEGLGRRHRGYGVRDEHYETVGRALLDTLRTALADAFTPDVESAWAKAYGALANTMKSAAAAPEPFASVAVV